MRFFSMEYIMFKTSEYVISAVSKKQFPNHNNLNEYVFLGRSNVGKSSLINAITGRKLLARTSSKPGKTQTINFFIIDEAFYLVDVPGYGYASGSAEKSITFGGYVEEYLKDNPNLLLAFLLVDTKVGPTHDDILMYNYLKHLGIKTMVVATKADKVGSTRLFSHHKKIMEKLKITSDELISTSVANRKGIEQVRNLLK
jgi:GTP-binding protein